MKTHLYKFYVSAFLLVCGVSSTYAQGYVDDLYYNKNNESHQRKKTKPKRTYSIPTPSTTPSSNQPWKNTLENDGTYINTTATKSSSDDEYYPGMFADAVGTNNNTQEYTNYDQQSDYQPSWYQNTVYVTVAPSWQFGFGFGLSPYYYNPWMASSYYYGGYWGNPWYVGYPYYGGWYGGGYYNGWYGGGWGHPHYGHASHPPRYTKKNSIYTGHVRGGSSSYRPSSTRPTSTYSRNSTGQYRPSTTSNRSTTGQFRPASTTKIRNTSTVTKPTTTNTNYQYNRSNTTTIRNSNTTNTTRSNSSTTRSNSNTTRSTGGGSTTRTYNRR